MSSTPTPRSYPFAIANAFSQDAFGGNPATIVFLDPSNPLTREECLKFAKGFNQPAVVFLTPTSAAAGKPGVVSFDVRYYSPRADIRLCGHGTVAAMKVILDSATNSPGFGQGSQFPAFSSAETHTAELTTDIGVVVSARKVVIPNETSGEGEDWFEITLPAGKLKELPAEEEERILGLFTHAAGKELKVKYIGTGEPPFQDDLILVLDESENLEQLKLDEKVLVGKTRVQGLHFIKFTEADIAYRKPLASKRTSSPQTRRAGSFQRITSPGCSPPL
jgi:predicted PhzF superfamily epimerase YddE/YHI9